MFGYVANQTGVEFTVEPTTVTTSSTDIGGNAIDLSTYEAAVLVHVFASDLSAGTATFIVQDSANGSTDWTAIDADDLVDENGTGAATFTGASTDGEVEETLAVRKQNVRRYIRVLVNPTGATGSFGAVVVGQKRIYP